MMGIVRGRSALARIARRLSRGMVVEVNPPSIVPADEAPVSIAQPPAKPNYPRHGFGQTW